MIIHRWGLIGYEQARAQMQSIHTQACKDKKNHLILCSHPNIFTLGSGCIDNFDVPTIQSDRGGSITCHTSGQNIYYFCFQVDSPARFYKKIIDVFTMLLQERLPTLYYDKKNPGFYMKNRKIASLGFRYSRGVSLHGVAINVDVDLAFHKQVAPCNLPNILPTSLHYEGVTLTQTALDDIVIESIKKSFYATV